MIKNMGKEKRFIQIIPFLWESGKII